MRLFADGLSSWLVRRLDGPDEWMVFDRPSGSERDLVVLAEVLGATVVQRHPTGAVRVVDGHGVARWDGLRWHHEPPVSSWIDTVTACDPHGDVGVVRALLEFAVHDLGSRGIGALLIYRPDGEPGPAVEARLPSRPRCRSAGPPAWPRSATPSPRSTAPRCSTPRACSASSACGSCRAPPPRPRSTATAACATPPLGATATTTPRPRSSW